MSPVNTIQNYHSNAKLMISGEYLVLRGAKALSVPLKHGQSLRISEHNGNPALEWKTYMNGQHWFDAIFSLNEFVIGNTNDFPTAQKLREILLAVKSITPGFLEKKVRYEVVAELDFDISWGLGSSSSLLVNIANWAGIDVYRLSKLVSSGSGYDLATAMSDSPIVYTLNDTGQNVKKVNFFPPFHEQLYFAYFGKKRNSAQAIKSFNEHATEDLSSRIHDIDAITDAIVVSKELREFRKLIRDHEKLISGILGIPPLSYKLLSDFSGDMKSLGAWGGDFILLATDMPRDYVVSWLRKKELNTWFSYEELAIKPTDSENARE